MRSSLRRLPSLLIALAFATVVSGCTLTVPFGAQLSAPVSMRAQQARRYTVAEPPRDGTSVLVILDDGSEVTGRWHPGLAGEDPRIETRDTVQTVLASRVVQIRGVASPSYLGRALALGLAIDALLFARYVVPSL